MKSSTESRLGTSDAGSAQAKACRMSSQPGCSWSCEAVAERDAPSGSPTCKQVIEPAPGIEPARPNTAAQSEPLVMASAHGSSRRRVLAEETTSVDKCDCALDHPAHRDHKGSLGPTVHGTGTVGSMTKAREANG